MIVATSQDLVALDCCGCSMPQCDAPRKEAFDICGFPMPSHPDVPAGEVGLFFAQREDRGDYIYHNVDSSSPPYVTTRDRESTQINTLASIADETTGICVESFVSGSFYLMEHLVTDDDGTVIDDQTYTDSTSAGPDEVWTGTLVTVFDPDPGSGSGTVASTTSYYLSLSPDSSWDYTTLGVFELSDPSGDYTVYDSKLTLTGVKSQPYRFGIPAGYTRSVWEMEWDEVAAPADWWDWYDDGMIGTEPTPGPTLATHRTWTWAGDTGEPWSPIFDPEPQATALVVRPANIMVICYRSTRLGVKPSRHGYQIAL